MPLPAASRETVTLRITIGDHIDQVFHAFVTLAPDTYDAPRTLTVFRSTLDACCIWLPSDLLPSSRLELPARLVLIAGDDLAWSRGRYSSGLHGLWPLDPDLMAPDVLTRWAWSKLSAAHAHDNPFA